MDDTIYKAMPVLNTLGINVNQYAPDNNALLCLHSKIVILIADF